MHDRMVFMKHDNLKKEGSDRRSVVRAWITWVLGFIALLKNCGMEEGKPGRKHSGWAWIWIAVGLVAVAVVGGCIGEKKTVDYVRTDFFRGNFSVSGTPSLNQSVNLVFTVDPIDDLPNSTIKLFLPDAISLVSGSKEWSGNFKKGERVHLNTTLKVTMPGEWEVRAYVVENSVPSDYREYYIYFNSTEKSGKVSRYPTPKNVSSNLSEQDIINRTRQYPKTIVST
jgi:hypothetical protein